MKIVRDVMSIGLVSSGVLGTQILLNDKWLWSAAPSHAIGLVGFVTVDLALALAIFWRPLFATLGGALASGLQLVAMLADMVIGQPMGVPAMDFRGYLLNDSSYLLLVLVQASILTVAALSLASPIIHRHARWAAFARIAKP